MSSHAPRLRYRRWPDDLGRGRFTWIAITANGIRLGYRRALTSFVLYSILVLVVANLFVFWSIAEIEALAGSPQASELLQPLQWLLGVDLGVDIEIVKFREVLWRSVFSYTLWWELVWVAVLVARIGPGLIANDLKARALPLYFARPITPCTYLLGKCLVPATFISLVALAPNLASLLIGAAMTGGLETTGQNLSLAADLVGVGVGMVLFHSVVIVALSSLTSDSRYVVVGWIAIILIPWFAQVILRHNLPPEAMTGFLASISIPDNLWVLIQWWLDIESSWEATGLRPEAYEAAIVREPKPFYPLIVFGVASVAGIGLSFRRIVRFSREAAGV